MRAILLGCCDEVGSKGMTLHERHPDCLNWVPVRAYVTWDEESREDDVTPGPWRVVTRPDGVLILVGSDDHTICEVRVCDDGTHPRKRREADAAFILAAVARARSV